MKEPFLKIIAAIEYTVLICPFIFLIILAEKIALKYFPDAASLSQFSFIFFSAKIATAIVLYRILSMVNMYNYAFNIVLKDLDKKGNDE